MMLHSRKTGPSALLAGHIRKNGLATRRAGHLRSASPTGFATWRWITAILVFTISMSPLPAFAQGVSWGQEYILASGSGRLSDLIRDLGPLRLTTTDGHAFQIHGNGLMSGAAGSVGVLVDGLEESYPFLGNEQLFAFSVAPSDLDAVSWHPGLTFLPSGRQVDGVIRLQTLRPIGFTIRSDISAVNPTGDPGPDLYRGSTAQNVDRSGPTWNVRMSYGTKTAFLEAGFLQDEHHLTDPAILERISSSYQGFRRPYRGIRASFARARFSGRRWTIDARGGHTNMEDLAWSEATGREWPLSQAWSWALTRSTLVLGNRTSLSFQTRGDALQTASRASRIQLPASLSGRRGSGELSLHHTTPTATFDLAAGGSLSELRQTGGFDTGWDQQVFVGALAQVPLTSGDVRRSASSTGRGAVSSQTRRGAVSSESGRGAVSSETGRGAVSSETGRGAVSSETRTGASAALNSSFPSPQTPPHPLLSVGGLLRLDRRNPSPATGGAFLRVSGPIGQRSHATAALSWTREQPDPWTRLYDLLDRGVTFGDLKTPFGANESLVGASLGESGLVSPANGMSENTFVGVMPKSGPLSDPVHLEKRDMSAEFGFQARSWLHLSAGHITRFVRHMATWDDVLQGPNDHGVYVPSSSYTRSGNGFLHASHISSSLKPLSRLQIQTHYQLFVARSKNASFERSFSGLSTHRFVVNVFYEPVERIRLHLGAEILSDIDEERFQSPRISSRARMIRINGTIQKDFWEDLMTAAVSLLNLPDAHVQTYEAGVSEQLALRFTLRVRFNDHRD